jgi:quercetin dioxygenase-like cupin family protein
MTDARGRAFVLRPGEGRDIDMGTFRMSLKASADDTGQAFSLLEAKEPPNSGPPMHIHHDAAEAFYVVSGEYVIFIGEDEYVCPAGSFIHIPAGVPHGFRVGAAPSRKLNIYAPAAMVGYFDELSAVIAADEMDDDSLAELARRHGMEVIGPVPEGYV